MCFGSNRNRADCTERLLYHRAGASPARVLDEINHRTDDEGVVGRQTFVVGPVDKHGPPNDQIARHETPVAAVLAIVSIVTHYKIMISRHDDLFAVPFLLEDWIGIFAKGRTPIHIIRIARLARRNVLDYQWS